MDSRQRAAWLLILLTVAPLPALAYLDPVSGSFVIQGLIAGVLAVVASLRAFRERLLGLFRRRPKPEPPADGDGKAPPSAPPPDARPPDA